MLKLTIITVLILFTIETYAVELQVFVFDPAGKPLQDIVVSVSTESGGPQNTEIVEISQSNKAFKPYNSVIQKNQPVKFTNHDDITHHVFSASRDQRFSFRLRPGSTNSEIRFTKVGTVSMGCNIHDWMSGYLLIVDTPYFSKTNADGEVILNIPKTGMAEVSIWHPQLPENENNSTEIILSDDNQITYSFRLTSSLEEIPAQVSGEDFEFLEDY